ncbi:MAG: TPM domain-containing protein [Deltaproteobacteria bacterium]|nr:TPM domain-containing protein [Deltaproteobacteria bacterium]
MVTHRTKTPVLFFSKKEKEAIVRAIVEAEKCTSGEIRVHLESGQVSGAKERAKEIFEAIGMTQTVGRSGVLIYLNTRGHEFAILGDAGIHAKVGPDYWQDTAARMERCFREDRFADGIAQAVREIGEKLKTHFPCGLRDVNELPDEISYS